MIIATKAVKSETNIPTIWMMSDGVNLSETIKQASAQDTALKKTIQNATDLSTDIGTTLKEVKSATTAANAAAGSANTAAKAAQDQTAAAKEATDALIAQTNHITFQLDPKDGGLNIVYTE